MSEQNEPLDARLRRLVSDAAEDAPRPPAVEEMAGPTSTQLPTTSSTTRRWVAGGAIGIAAALVAALIVLPNRQDDAVPLDAPNETVVEASPTVPDTMAPEATTPVEPDVESPAPTTTPTSQETTTVPVTPLVAPTVIAAVDVHGDAVLIPTDGSAPLVMYDGPDPDAPAPQEGPGPTVVDSIALTPEGNHVFVGLCCEPAAGSILSGAPDSLDPMATMFGYAPAVSPDGRYVAIGQVEGPVVAVTDMTTGSDLEVSEFGETVGHYSPYDTMWLDGRRLISIGIESADDGTHWIAVPMVVNGADVTVGESLVLGETIEAGDTTVVRVAGAADTDSFAIHGSDNSVGVAIEFRLDGMVVGDPLAAVAEPGASIRSIWYQPDGPTIWVDGDGALHRGDQKLGGDYLWARPTDATTFPTDTGASDVNGDVDGDIAPADAIDLSDATVFGLGFGTPADPDEVTTRLGTALGPPTFDTGWQPTPADFGEPWAACFGPQFRTVWFGDFRITFEETGSSGVRVGAWSVGDPAVDGSAPVGDLPADQEASGVSADGVGVGASREAVLAVVPQDGRIIRDDEDGVAVTGAIVTSFDIDDQDVVTGIGSGRLDCTAGAN